MLTWLFVATSVAASAPIPVEPKGNPASWVRASDLPAIDGNAAVTTLDLMINQSGRPTDCKVIVSSSASDLDAAACASLLKRARFKPAKDADGVETASAYRDRIVWLPNASGPNFWYKAPDLVVSTPELSGPLKDTAEVVVVTDPRGTTGTCSISKSVGNSKLDQVACSVATNPQFSPPIMNQGAPVRGVRLLRIGFEAGATHEVRVR